MNAFQMAKTAYTAPGAPTRTTRSTEYALFADITRRLRDTNADRARFAEFARAIHDNRALWTVLATDVADPANGLPPGLRAQIFYLSEFTAAQSGKVLAGKADAQVLIEINTAIMRGLRGAAS